MVDYQDSSQLNLWLFDSVDQLQECRDRANFEARKWLAEQESSSSTTNNNNTSTHGKPPHAPVSVFACGYAKSKSHSDDDGMSTDYFTSQGPWKTSKGEHDFLTPTEETTLISFYASKLSTLIGPKASISRLRRESKVTATAALLYRRFFLSNSVLLFDPKAILVAAAFLASKVEDAMADVRYLQEGTERMQAPVSVQEIISAELSLLQGCHYDLLCFHPFKSVLALTEDLRTFLKSDKGQNLVQRPISGQDLKPIYDKARTILEQATTVSDLPLLYSPGPIGLASLIVAQDLLEKAVAEQSPPPRIDFYGYVRQRFPEREAEQSTLLENLPVLCERLQELVHHSSRETTDNLAELKKVHKKLKKVRYWGENSSSSSSSSNKEGKKKKKKKSSTAASSGADEMVDPGTNADDDKEEEDISLSMPPPPKRVKLEE